MWTTEELKKLPYTYKEIVEIGYPEIWDLAQRTLQIAETWQEMTVKLMPLFKKRPTLLDFLKVRSIYGLAYYIADEVNRLCHQLAFCDNKQAVEGFGERTDFHVMDCYSKEGRHSTWSFLDIVGTLKNGNSSYDSLWEAANNSSDPTKPNIAGLMTSEEDDKLIRMY